MDLFCIIISFVLIFFELLAIIAAIMKREKSDKSMFIFDLLYPLFLIAIAVLLIVQSTRPREITVDQPLESSTEPVRPSSPQVDPVPMAKVIFPQCTVYPYVHVDKEEPVLQALAEDGFFYYSHYYKGDKLYSMPMTEKWQKIVYEYCNKYDLDYETVLAIGGVETSFDVHRGTVESKYNGSTYFGLGMVNKYYYEKRTGTTLATERDGINALCDTLARKLKEFDGDYIYALMAYNGGSSYARKRIENGVYSSTYVEKVMRIKNGLLKWKGEQK